MMDACGGAYRTCIWGFPVAISQERTVPGGGHGAEQGLDLGQLTLHTTSLCALWRRSWTRTEAASMA